MNLTPMRRLASSAFALVLASFSAHAQIEVGKGTFSNGAGVTNGTSISIAYTIGEPVASMTAGPSINIQSGFWAVGIASLPCPADLTGDSMLNFFDVSIFIGLYNAADPAADIAAPFGIINFFDIALFIQQFNQGCP